MVALSPWPLTHGIQSGRTEYLFLRILVAAGKNALQLKVDS